MPAQAFRSLTPAVMLIGVVLVGALVPAPVVALGLGPTFDTLGDVNGRPVLTVGGLPEYPTTGHLNMTTVGVTDGITTFQALKLWASSDHQLLPRSEIYQPGQTEEQVNGENQAEFDASVAGAEAAVLTFLQLPARITVGAVTPASPSAGLLQSGDEIVAVAGRSISSLPALYDVLGREAAPGRPIALVIRRADNRPRTVTVVPSPSPDDPGRGFLGIRPAVLPAQGERLGIELSDVGGPSAGLMFALGLIDKLTPGALTGGRFVAGTGTITADGVVGPISGIRFKMLRASEVGATTFLVPADNCAEAATGAPDGLQLVRVGSLTEAVSALDALRTGGTPPACS